MNRHSKVGLYGKGLEVSRLRESEKGWQVWDGRVGVGWRGRRRREGKGGGDEGGEGEMSIMFEGLILPICLHLNALILLSISSTEPFNHGEFIFAICMCIFPIIGTKILYMLRLSVCSNDPTSVITDSSLSAK